MPRRQRPGLRDLLHRYRRRTRIFYQLDSATGHGHRLFCKMCLAEGKFEKDAQVS